jgi:hypothetical protein
MKVMHGDSEVLECNRIHCAKEKKTRSDELHREVPVGDDGKEKYI